ncbi:hypothetical protein BD779DRAFT_1473075 [Infundibulicybe gibba]|nr:hypothetical protein BD779DRAFT_1473075 [Infundibulicybe gibba]
MFATGNGGGEAVTIYAQQPPQSQHQFWHVFCNKKKNQYTIKFIELDGSERYGFSWDGCVGPESLVVLGKPQEFTISPIESDKHACIIRPITNIIGVDICVGVNDHTREVHPAFHSVPCNNTRGPYNTTVTQPAPPRAALRTYLNTIPHDVTSICQPADFASTATASTRLPHHNPPPLTSATAPDMNKQCARNAWIRVACARRVVELE